MSYLAWIPGQAGNDREEGKDDIRKKSEDDV